MLIDDETHNVAQSLSESHTYRADISVLSLTSNFDRDVDLFQHQTYRA